MPSKSIGLPAGFEFSESEDEDDYYSPKKIVKQPEAKTLIQLKKERLLQFINHNDLEALRDELTNGPKGLDIDDSLDGRWNCLYHACFLALPETVVYLVEERGSYVNLENGSETPLLIACYSEANSEQVLKVVEALLNNSANFRISNATGVTPLMHACNRGHIEVVKFLISKGDLADTLDNEGNNALFYAIEGGQLEIARILMKGGIDWSTTNVYGVSAENHAINENQLEIAELFPKDPPVYQPPVNFLNYNRFEDLIPTPGSKVPAYFPDVTTMLKGMSCERFTPNFAQARVSLEEFLQISDERLIEIGIDLPLHRKLIRIGLYKFHIQEWSVQSLYIPLSVEYELGFFDLTMIVANLHRQLVIIKAQYAYMMNLGDVVDLSRASKKIDLEHINRFSRTLKSFETMMKKKFGKHVVTRPLLINKDREKSLKRRRAIKFTALILVPLIAFGAFKMLVE